MFHLAAFSTIALSLAVSVSSLVVPRATPPAGWNTELLENYDTYHTRYMALSCNTKHNSAFFDQCCHPLLATQTLATARPAQCIPTTTTAAPAASTPDSTASDDGDDDDLPFCDEGDDEGDDDSTTPAAPAATKAPAAVTTPPAAVTTPPPKKVTTPAPAKPATTPASNSANSNVNTGGVATFFYQNNQFGACGQKHKDTDFIAAIDGARYGNLGAVSSLCGKQVQITNTQNKKTVTVTIEDACPTCNNANSIDLSVGAFEQLADLNTGEVPITWEFV